MLNSTAYFSNVKLVADVKKLYLGLAAINHPSNGSGGLVLSAVNAEYLQTLAALDGQVTIDEDGNEHTYFYNQETEQAIIDFIDRLFTSGVTNQGCQAYLIGTWVWIQGDTKPVKDTLKELGCVWHAKRLCWYYRPGKGKWFGSKGSLGSLAAQYGVSQIGKAELA